MNKKNKNYIHYLLSLLKRLLDLAFPFPCSAQLEFQNEMKWQKADNFIYAQATERSSKGSFKT